MKLHNSVNGNVPFEGDRVFRWRTIPANAKILSAIATVTPVESQLIGSFIEELDFTPSSVNFGATLTTAVNPPPAPATPTVAWIEVDFHARRTLAGVVGNFNNTNLQVDVGGGTYVEINKNGAFKTPSDAAGDLFVLSGSPAPLPGLTVSKLKLTNAGVNPAAPSLSSLTIRSVPTNVSLRVGELAPFFTHLGELLQPETSPDFSAVLQAALTTTKVENGFYDLAIGVHSDSISRLKIDLDIEFLEQQSVLPAAVPEVAVPFDVSSVSKSPSSELNVTVPANSKVVASQTSARVRGSFVETRVAFGPTGPAYPAGAVEVSSSSSQAQIVGFKDPSSPIPELVTLTDEISAVAIDLLLESLTPSAKLQLDIRGDFDGKPDEIPLLPAPVAFGIEQQPQKGPAWTSVSLPAEFLFAKGSKKPARYWLLLQCLEGRAAWSLREPTPGSAEDKAAEVTLQLTRDGGLSFKPSPLLANTTPTPAAKLEPPFVSFFRLRNRPKTFKMPVSLLIGSEENRDKQVRKKLDRFEPLGRVDFTIDSELADGINEYVEAISGAVVPEAQHVSNGDFEQWDIIGNQMNSRGPIALGAPIHCVAFSPGGNLAYVLDQLVLKSGVLLVVDVDCNQELEDDQIAMPITDPTHFVVSPDGKRAYVTNGRAVQVVNLEGGHAVGNAVNVVQSTPIFEQPISRLALSGDGRRLYIVTLSVATVKLNRIRIFDTTILEQVAEGKIANPTPQGRDAQANGAQLQSPLAIVLSPDEKLLYLLVDRGAANPAVVEIVDISGPVVSNPLGSPPLGAVAVGRGPIDMAVTPDGKTVVVPNETDGNVSIINTSTRTASIVNAGAQPRVVALALDSALAYVFNQGPRTITTIDLNRRLALDHFSLNETPTSPPPRAESMALSPRGDQLYVVNSVSNTLSSVQFGQRRPSEWQLTSGDIKPACLDTPFHLVAELGSANLSTALSQVVPVAESFPYELSFWGIATESPTDDQPALAEILWLGDDCGQLQTDSIRIEIAPDPAPSTPKLVFHRLNTRTVNGASVPLTAPPGVKQAEIRFSLGKATTATIDLVSLSATSEALSNGDFKSKKDGQLTGWTLEPDTTPGFVVTEKNGGLQLQNVGATTAELVQTVVAQADQPFVVEFEGKSSATSQTPHIELRWLNASKEPAADPTVVQLLPAALDLTTANGTVPAGSAEVQVRIAVPPGSTLDVKRFSLRYERFTVVPVKFIAESAGDLNISDVRIGFERVEPKAPPIPADTLCRPTPPSGEHKDHTCYCAQCEQETEMVATEQTTTPAGRPATKGRCANCSSEVVSVGGRVATPQAAIARQTIEPRPVIVRTVTVTAATPQAAAQVARLIDIHGIGERRAQQLTDIGIDSVEKLASATPESVLKIRFITEEMATRIIAEAKSLTGL
jgi:DNA-binding beta-propeller fold protein YncE